MPHSNQSEQSSGFVLLPWTAISKALGMRSEMRAVKAQISSRRLLSTAICPRPALIVIQMFGSRSKYSSSSFFPPSPLPTDFTDSMNSMRSIHFTIL